MSLDDHEAASLSCEVVERHLTESLARLDEALHIVSSALDELITAREDTVFLAELLEVGLRRKAQLSQLRTVELCEEWDDMEWSGHDQG